MEISRVVTIIGFEKVPVECHDVLSNGTFGK